MSAFPATFVAVMGAAAGTRKNKRAAAKRRIAAKRYQPAKPKLAWLTVQEYAAQNGLKDSAVRRDANAGAFEHVRREGRRILIGVPH